MYLYYIAVLVWNPGRTTNCDITPFLIRPYYIIIQFLTALYYYDVVVIPTEKFPRPLAIISSPGDGGGAVIM